MQNRELDHLYLEYQTEDMKEQGENRDIGSVSSGGNSRKPGRRDPKNRKLRSLIGVLAGMLIGILVCAVVFKAMIIKSNGAVKDLDYQDKIEMILQYLELYYLNDLDEQTIEDALARGLMENIGDKYAEYYTEEEFQSLIESMNGEYAGIGVMITQREEDKAIEVYRVYADSPAEEAGIQIKDVLVEAAGIRDFETMDDLVALVRGEPGTTVDLVIERDGEEIPMTIERRAIIVDYVYGEMLTDTVGYIQISEFTQATVKQFEDAIDDLTAQGMTSVIMDLRNNPGGDYDSVVAMCDRVVPEGVIVSVEDKMGGMQTENSDAECLDIPIVLLVNDNTASAAELFTMCLRDYDMAEVVGTTTYGKGIVQSIYQLIDGSGLKFTTEKYYGPAGNYIQDTGIEPDYVVEIPEETYEDGVISVEEDLQLQKAAELLQIALEYNEETGEYEFVNTGEETEAADDGESAA